MRHFVQYFNPDKIGRDPDHLDGLFVYTNKFLRGVPVEGSVVWLLGGRGRPRTYHLLLWFVATTVEACDHPAFMHTIRGDHGYILPSQPRLDREPWFPAFRRDQGNFAFGFTELTNEAARAAFVRLAEETGPPLP